MSTPQTRSRHLIIPGAQRCGTTYLRSLLAAHPGVSMADPARPEPKAFLDAGMDRATYLDRWFAHAQSGDLLGEKSTSYLDHPEVPPRITRALGDDVLVLVQLRDPIARAISHWAFSTEHDVETLPLEEALDADLAGSRDWDPSVTSTSPYAYLSRGRYVDGLVPWLTEFGDRLRVVFLEEMAADPAAVAATYDWLGLAPHAPGDVRRVNASTTPAPRLAGERMRVLRDWFGEADQALTALLGRPLPWRATNERDA